MPCLHAGANRALRVGVSSAFVNAFNFVLFDIALATLVYLVTADIAGLSNSSAARARIRNRLNAYNPLFVGTGLTCTRRNISLMLALVRFITMTLILCTNFLIEGARCQVVTTQLQKVVVHGHLSIEYGQTAIRQFTLRRRGCQGRKGDLTYYGELRVDNNSKYHCELREDMMTTVPVYFGINHEKKRIDYSSPCTQYTNDKEHQHVHRFSCPGRGTIVCTIHQGTNKTRTQTESCNGLVLLPNKNERGKRMAYMCQGDALFPGNEDGQKPTKNRMATCQLAKNLDVYEKSWAPIIFRDTRTIRDTIDALYGVGVKDMMVNVTSTNVSHEVADVHLAWFWLLGVLIVLLVVLGSIASGLRRNGLRPSANSERLLGSLLAQSAAPAAFARLEFEDGDIENGMEGNEGRVVLLRRIPCSKSLL